MIKNKKNNSHAVRRFFSRVSFFFYQTGHFWGRLAIVVGLVVVVLLFHHIVSVYIGGGSIFGKKIDCEKITRIDVRHCSTISKNDLLRILGIKEGMPLFSCDSLSGKIGEILEIVPTIASIDISRKSSGVVDIFVSERIPIARIAGTRLAADTGTRLAVDAGGVVFSSRSNERVPEFLGFNMELIAPGTNLYRTAKSNQIAALQLVNYLKEINGNIDGTVFSLASADVSNSYRLDCVFNVLNSGIHVQLAWKGMGTETPESLKNLKNQLKVLEKTYNHPQSEGGRLYILTRQNECHLQ